MSLVGKLPNPYLDLRVVFPFVRAWTENLAIKFLKRIVGKMGLRRMPHEKGLYPAVDRGEP